MIARRKNRRIDTPNEAGAIYGAINADRCGHGL
jgi:hypothetical protein